MDKIVERVADRIEAVILVRTDLGSEDARRDFVRRQARAAITETLKALAEDVPEKMVDAAHGGLVGEIRKRGGIVPLLFDTDWPPAIAAAFLSLK